MGKVRLFHATSARNAESIREKGLLSKWEGVYLTDTAESAARWIGFRLAAMGEPQMIVVEVEVEEKGLVEGCDHSPLMVQIFGAGKSLVSPKTIPPSKIKEIHYYQLNEPPN
jgi:RNA:NAD 2'-phosphotransferase (TPT1/KptA family)